MKSDLQAVFIDRDGTIGGTGYYIHPDEFSLFPWAKEALDLLKNSGIKIFAVTNQPFVDLGIVNEDQIYKQLMGYGFDNAYICTHKKEVLCSCRKPQIEMFTKAAKEYKLDLKKCAVIGDIGETDIIAAHRIGAIKILVRTGLGEGSLNEFRHTWAGIEVNKVCDNLLEAVKWLLKMEYKR